MKNMKVLLLSIVLAVAALVACNEVAPTPVVHEAGQTAKPPVPRELLAKMGDFVEVRRQISKRVSQVGEAARAASNVGVSHAPRLMALAPSATPSSWSTPNWFIDGSNVSGCAADTNSGQNATCGVAGQGPLLTYKELKARWGTVQPVLSQVTILDFISDQAAGDPVVLRPTPVGSGSFAVVGELTQVATGTFASVTARVKATGQQLVVDLGVACAPLAGMLLHNSTHVANAWVESCTGATTAILTQPVQPGFAPPSTYVSRPQEVNTFASGDAFTVSSLPKIQLIDFSPVTSSLLTGVTVTAPVYMTHVRITGDLSLSTTRVATNLAIATEFRADPYFVAPADPFTPTSTLFNNNFWSSSITAVGINPLGLAWYSGGAIENASNTGISVMEGSFGNDILTHGIIVPAGASNIVTLYNDSLLVALNSITVAASPEYGGAAAIWGPAFVLPYIGSQIRYAGTAAGAFLNSGGLALTFGFYTTAWSVTTGQPAVWNGGVPLTPAALDACPASASAFCGYAEDFPSGAAFGKYQ